MFTPSLVIFAAFATKAFAQCSYSFLQQVTSAYVAAQASGQPANLTSATTYTENFLEADISTGILSQPLKIDNSRSLHDTTACATYTEVIVANGANHYVIGTQIRLLDGIINQIDSIITTEGDWLFNATGTLYYARGESWSVIPEEKRDSRATIQSGGDAYLNLFNDPTTEVPWGTPCARLEGGIYTGRGLPDDTCNVGVPSGVPLVNRRYVIDETVGAADVFLDFNGPGGRPDSHEFRLENGKIRYVHTITYMRGH